MLGVMSVVDTPARRNWRDVRTSYIRFVALYGGLGVGAAAVIADRIAGAGAALVALVVTLTPLCVFGAIGYRYVHRRYRDRS